jgi:hypothetical protein
LSQSWQNMQPLLCQTISSSCVVASHPFTWTTFKQFIQFGALNARHKSQNMLTQGMSSVVTIDIPSCRQNLMLGLKDSFLFQKIACTALFLIIYFIQWSSDKWTVHMQGLASFCMLDRDAESFFPVPFLHNHCRCTHLKYLFFRQVFLTIQF